VVVGLLSYLFVTHLPWAIWRQRGRCQTCYCLRAGFITGVSAPSLV